MASRTEFGLDSTSITTDSPQRKKSRLRFRAVEAETAKEARAVKAASHPAAARRGR